MANKHGKDAPYHTSSGKCKLKEVWHANTVDVEQQEFSYIVDRNAKWYNNVGRQLDGILQN